MADSLSVWQRVPRIAVARLQKAAELAADEGFWTPEKREYAGLGPVDEYVFVFIAATIMSDEKLDSRERELVVSFTDTSEGSPEETSKIISRLHSLSKEKDWTKPPAFFRGIVERDVKKNSRHSIDALIALYATWCAFAVSDTKISAIETTEFHRYFDPLGLLVIRAGLTTVEDLSKRLNADTSIVDVVRASGGNERARALPTGAALDTLLAFAKEEDALKDLPTLLAELNELVGLDAVKNDVRSLTNRIRFEQERKKMGKKVAPLSQHLVFTGNPGTGKTTVARILADIYRAVGLLTKGHLVETDRSGLVGGYVGQTAIKTREVVDRALGGALFIDEAYSLSVSDSPNDYGREAVDTILKLMEDRRDELVVIVAGYNDRMASFLNSNPGLKSRFNKFINFPDYGPDELIEIFRRHAKAADYSLTPEADKKAAALLRTAYERKEDNFGNARLVRNLFEQTVAIHSDRVAEDSTPTAAEFCLITAADIPDSPVLN